MVLMDADVVIIGLGAAGAFAALELVERGYKVIGLERDALLHDNGAYAGESRLFRAAYHEGTEYLPMLLDSRKRWQEIQKHSRRDLFMETGVLSIGAPDSPSLVNVQRSLIEADLPHEALDADDIRRRFPQQADIRDDVGFLDQLGGVLRPEAAVAEIHRQAQSRGASLRPYSEVKAIDERPGGVDVVTSAGTLRAAQVIVSAGVWTPAILPQLETPLAIKPIALTWYAPEDPSQFTPDIFPGFIRDRGDTHVFGTPTMDGSLIKAGFAADWGEIDTPSSLQRRLSTSELHHVEEAVQSFLHGLPNGTSRQSVHMDVFTADKRPMIGKIADRITVATGFSGHGFKLSPALGLAAATTAIDAEPPYDLAPFSPERFV